MRFTGSSGSAWLSMNLALVVCNRGAGVAVQAHLNPLARGAAGIRHFVLFWENFPIFR
jgi:N-methylhydantoinase B/oxoprolinase/acetone carboxylase alpha subunit